CCHFQSLPLCYNTTDNLIALTLDSPDTLILVAEPGDDVTIWYQHNLMEAVFIYWFKHTNHSVPHHAACQLYLQYFSSRPCSLVNQSKHIVMTVNSQNTSLTITGVNYTDSGLYYCGIPQSTHISFSNATYLHVIAHCFSEVYFMLTVVFGGVIVILISVLLVMLKRRKQHQDGTFFVLLQEQDSKYAALHFSDKKIKKSGRHTEVMDTEVVYSSVRH
uniref:Ig-like domain-containing protein n=1 Tax=Electrophorus electricus TaxID=8005 RepID=A0A4W4DNZ6_ELEEL